MTYTPDGLVFQKTLPVAIGSDTPQKLSANPGLITTSVYDALGRVVSISDITGTTKTLYEGLTTKTWDHANIAKDYIVDAFGNLVGVVEYDTGKQYTTTYEYDIVGNLLRLTDALGNTRSFTYNMRGKRLSAEDIHPQGSSAVIYRYTYDQVGNLIGMRTPAGILVTYDYNKNNQNNIS